jgi:uncharacterized membrane protein
MNSDASAIELPKPTSEGHLRSLIKAATWRATGTLDTFVLSFLFTGNLKVAGSIASTEVITKIGLFYAHERVWNRVSWGRSASQKTVAGSGSRGEPYPLASGASQG